MVAFPSCYPAVVLAGCSVREALCDAEMQMKALRAFRDLLRPDVVFALPDLTVEAEALGMQVDFFDDRPPELADGVVPSLQDILKAEHPDPEKSARMPVFLRVVEEMSGEEDLLCGASVAGPLTLLSLLVRGENWLAGIGSESLLLESLDFTTAVVAEYASALASRSSLVMVMDPVASILRKGTFGRLYLPYLKGLFGIIRSAGAAGIYHVCGDVARLLEEMMSIGMDGILFDGGTDLPGCAERLPQNLVLLGNLARGLLRRGSEDDVRWETRRLLRSLRRSSNFVVSTGCDVPTDAPLRNLEAVVEEVRA